MKNFHIFHLLAALAFGTTNSASAHQTKSDASFSFTLPNNWKSSSNKRNENCQFFKMTSSSSTTEWDLKACNYQGNLEEVLRFTVFAKDGKKWIASGSMDQQPAAWKSNGIDSTFIETKHPPTCGVINKNSGFRAAGGQCYSALVGCKKDYLIIESNGLNMHFSAMKKNYTFRDFQRMQQNCIKHNSIILRDSADIKLKCSTRPCKVRRCCLLAETIPSQP